MQEHLPRGPKDASILDNTTFPILSQNSERIRKLTTLSVCNEDTAQFVQFHIRSRTRSRGPQKYHRTMKPKSLSGAWRLLQPIRSAQRKSLLNLPTLYRDFFRDWKEYRHLNGLAPFEDLHPCLFDRDAASQTGGGHYFYQDVWALNKLAELAPKQHHDVGSRLDGFVGQATSICPIVHWDIRPVGFRLPNLEFRHGCLTCLPIPDQSIESVSCLHVAEHVGLGRYGDPIDPGGTDNALRELMRLLAPGGQMLLSIPVGKERVCFNGERITNPERVVGILTQLELLEFSVVNDDDEFVESARISDYATAINSCGLYRFIRK